MSARDRKAETVQGRVPADRLTGMQEGKQPGRRSGRRSGRQADRQAGRWSGRQADRQAGRRRDASASCLASSFNLWHVAALITAQGLI